MVAPLPEVEGKDEKLLVVPKEGLVEKELLLLPPDGNWELENGELLEKCEGLLEEN